MAINNGGWSFTLEGLATASSNGYSCRTNGDPTSREMLGYITSTTDYNSIDQNYTVYIPELDLTVKGPMACPVGSTGVNGVGEKPFTLEVGTPVMVRYMSQSRQIYISHAVNYSGLSYAKDVLNTRTLSIPDSQPLYTSPLPIVGTELGFDSRVIIRPLNVGRGDNPNYENPVQTGLFLPGSMEVHSKSGISYYVDPNATFRYSNNSFKKRQGLLQTYADKAREFIEKEFETSRNKYESTVKRNFIFVDGKINPGGVEKVVKFLRSNSEAIDNALDTTLNFLQQLENAVQVGLRYVALADKIFTWMNQGAGAILEDLFDTFGKFEFDFGLIKVDLNLSLDSIDLNLDFRLGVGIPLLDKIINQTINKVVNEFLDKLLKNFSIGKLLGLDMSSSPGHDPLNPKNTYVENIFTPILRSNGLWSKNPNIREIINDFTDLIKLDEEEYLSPNIVIKSTKYDISFIEKLRKYLVSISSNPILYYLPDYLNSFYINQTEEDFIACCVFCATNIEDKLRLIFLYGYYTLDVNKVKTLVSLFLEPKQVNLLVTRYNWSTKDNYDNLLNHVEDGNIYDPLVLNTFTLKNSLVSEVLKDGIEYLELGQLAHYINQVFINTAKVDLRFNLVEYIRFKELVNSVYPILSIGY